MTPAERAARERKQKIFVLVGGLVLVGLLAIQLPKLLGGSSPSPSAAPTTATEASSGAPAPGATSVVASRSLAVQPGLTSFSRLGGKDPFVQQVKFSDAPSPSGSSGPSGKTGTTGKTEAKSAGKVKEPPAKPATRRFSLGTQPVAAMTVVSVNGARQALSPGARFPAADPVFVLVSENQQAKSVVVGVAGGGYASGSKTTKLVVGKPLVLVNTTTGARYKLVLVAVGSGEAAAAKGSGKNDAGANTPPSKTPSAP